MTPEEQLQLHHDLFDAGMERAARRDPNRDILGMIALIDESVNLGGLLLMESWSGDKSCRWTARISENVGSAIHHGRPGHEQSSWRAEAETMPDAIRKLLDELRRAGMVRG